MYCVWYGIVIDQYGIFCFHAQNYRALRTANRGQKYKSQMALFATKKLILQWYHTAAMIFLQHLAWVGESESPSQVIEVKSKVALWLELAERNLTWLWPLLLLDFDLSWSASWLDLTYKVGLTWNESSIVIVTICNEWLVWPRIRLLWRTYWSFGNCEETMLFTGKKWNFATCWSKEKFKNDEPKFSPIMAVKWEENVFKCD